MKSYTDLEQSKKLAEILPLESADMRYVPFGDTHPWVWDEEVKLLEKGSVPCWSLAALLGVLRGTNISTPDPLNKITYSCWNDYDITYASNPIDACVDMIIRLHELNSL